MLVIEYAVLSECGSKKLYQHDISLEVPLRCIYDMSESLNAGAGIAVSQLLSIHNSTH